METVQSESQLLIAAIKPPRPFAPKWAFGCKCGFGLETNGDLVLHVNRVLGHLRLCGLHRHHATKQTASYLALAFMEGFADDDQKPLYARAMRELNVVAEKVSDGFPTCGACP